MDSQSNKPLRKAASESRQPGEFADTRWSQVILAGEESTVPAMKAKEELCAAYWPPIYGFLRRSGRTQHDAEDLTQQFFVRVLGSDLFSQADRSKGRFRSFLLGALKHFLLDETRKALAQKRGGGLAIMSIEFNSAEEAYMLEPDPHLTPEEVYDHRWAATLLELAFRRLEADFAVADQQERFEQLKTFLSERPSAGDYADRAKKLGMTSNGVAAVVARMRQRYRELVRAVVADTLLPSEDIDTELQELFG